MIMIVAFVVAMSMRMIVRHFVKAEPMVRTKSIAILASSGKAPAGPGMS